MTGKRRICSAVARAGGIGFITPRSFPTPRFPRATAGAHDLSDGKPFGVNLYISARPEANQMRRYSLRFYRRACEFVETRGSRQRNSCQRSDAGMIVMHKCTTLRHARSRRKLALTLLRSSALKLEAIGMDMIGTMVQGAVVPQELDAGRLGDWYGDRSTTCCVPCAGCSRYAGCHSHGGGG